MTVEFAKAKVPAMQIAAVTWRGTYDEKRMRKEAEAVADWAKSSGVLVGRWMVVWKGGGRIQVALEVKGSVHGTGRIRVRKLPASSVVRVDFDPEIVSASVVYHGLNDHLRHRKLDKEIRSVGDYREVYDGNPWDGSTTWKRCRVEALVRR